MSQANKPNKLMDFLNVELPDIKRSNCNLTRANRFTASVGYIYPTLVEEILPSDRVRCNIRTILKSNPTVNSVYGSMRQSHQAFFVPLRLYIKALDQNFTFGENPALTDNLPDFPYEGWIVRAGELTYGKDRGFVNPGSLLEMLEMFPSNFNFANAWSIDDETAEENYLPRINAVPLIAYYDIVRNYYFNSQELEMPFVSGEYFTFRTGAIGSTINSRAVVYQNVSKQDLDRFVSDVYNLNIGIGDGDTPIQALESIGVTTVSMSPFYGSRDNTIDEPYLNVHLGYGVRCFDDDYFTTALANEYVEAIDSSARVTVNNGSFAVSQLLRARRMARFVSRDVLGGTNYDDYVYVHFNTKLGRELNKPYFLGSCSNDFWFEDIYSTAATSEDALGTRAGRLDQSMSFNEFIDFTASEFGYLVVVSSIIPRISYYAGIPKKYLKTSMADLYSPEFDAWGFQGIPEIEINAMSTSPVWDFSSGENGYPMDDPDYINNWRGYSAFSIHTRGLAEIKQQPAWFEHMASYDRIHGLFTTDYEHSFSVLTKSFDFDGSSSIDEYNQYMSTYIHPWEFQYLFKYQPSWYDNFTWQILFDLNIYRPISKQVLPSY